MVKAKERKWIMKPRADAGLVSRLSSELGIDPVLAGFRRSLA